MAATVERAAYGQDAPGVVRNLALGGAAALLVAVAACARWIPRNVVWRPAENVSIAFPIAVMSFWTAAGLIAGALWMVWGSRSGKLHERDRLLDRIAWRGDEQVLDVGCGRGLLLIGAAKRLQSGVATGVDLWQAEDLSGNRPEVPLRNAALEGVAARVRVETADMRKLPFPDASFDVVVSRAAIHNLYEAADRATAIREIARVMKPGATALLSDIRHHSEYAQAFRASGVAEVRTLDSVFAQLLCTLFTFGSLRPNTTLARKGDAR
jgi:ubiquinone/menaquinone biosynthesis C-methylase UbiE